MGRVGRGGAALRSTTAFHNQLHVCSTTLRTHVEGGREMADPEEADTDETESEDTDSSSSTDSDTTTDDSETEETDDTE